MTSEKRFECVFKEHETKNSWSMIKDNQLDKPLYIKDVVDLLNELAEENEELRQILKDIVMATDETYTKNRSIYKVSVVFDNETYLKIRECLNE